MTNHKSLKQQCEESAEAIANQPVRWSSIIAAGLVGGVSTALAVASSDDMSKGEAIVRTGISSGLSAGTQYVIQEHIAPEMNTVERYGCAIAVGRTVGELAMARSSAELYQKLEERYIGLSDEERHYVFNEDVKTIIGGNNDYDSLDYIP